MILNHEEKDRLKELLLADLEGCKNNHPGHYEDEEVFVNDLLRKILEE